jgi:AraC family transcriptional regulator
MTAKFIAASSRIWGMDPVHSLGAGPASISAAIWSGPPTEIWSELLDVTVLAVALGTYRADVFADGRFRGSPDFRHGDLQLMQRGVSPRAAMGEGWRLLHIYLPHSLLTRAVEEDQGIASATEFLDPIGRRDPALSALGLALAREIESACPPSPLLVDGLGCAAAVHLVRRWSNTGSRLSAANAKCASLTHWQLRRSTDLLASAVGEGVRLDDLARQANLSPFHFARAFKASTGVPPHRYLVQLRIEKARELLEASDLLIGEIAARVGYDDPGYFARLFRREVGATPAQYRQERRR